MGSTHVTALGIRFVAMPMLRMLGALDQAVAHHVGRDVVRIGRSSANDIVLQDPDASRRHAEIRRKDGAWILEDLGSRLGTRLNGSRILGPSRIETGDVISIGRIEMHFDALERDVAATGITRADREADGSPPASPFLVGRSQAMLRLGAVIDRVAPSDATVLILGEPGTGKELVARQLHRRSGRAAAPFVVVNCPALPSGLVESELFGVAGGVATGVERREGKLEQAASGTLFLDEIGDLDLGAQAKLLRFLQDKTFERVGGRQVTTLDVRVVAATNRDVAAEAARGNFRADLLQRLAVVTLRLPPLRERLDDVPLLAEHLLARQPGPKRSLGADALASLAARSWPGNVRELEHVLVRACLLSDGEILRRSDLEEAATGETPAAAASEDAAGALLDRIGSGESFWEIVRGPYLRREIPKSVVRALVARAHAAGGGSYKGLSRVLGIEKDHKKLLNFLWTQGLRPDDE